MPEVIKKVWGRERVIVNNELYCGKILEIDCGGVSSLHYHPKKDETFYVLEGECVVLVGFLAPSYETPILLNMAERAMLKGDTIRIGRHTAHRFYCTLDMKEGCKIIEFSTSHSDEDVVRLEPSKKL